MLGQITAAPVATPSSGVWSHANNGLSELPIHNGTEHTPSEDAASVVNV